MPSRDFGRDKPRTVSKKPAGRKTSTVTIPGVGVVRHAQTHKPKPAPPAPSTWTRPLGPVTITPPAPVPPPYKGSARQKQLHAHNRVIAQQRHRRQQDDLRAARHDVLAALGLAPRRTVTSVGFAPSPPVYIGPRLPNARDSGVANNPATMANGVVLSPQQIQRDMAAVLRPGGAQRKIGAIERLHAAGISDPFGSTTHREALARSRAIYAQQLAAAQRAFLDKYRQVEKTQYGINQTHLSDEEVLDRVAGWTPEQLMERVRNYQPSALQMQGARLQSEGLNLDIRAIPDALVTGITAAGEGVKSLAGDSVAANALADALYFPIGAVGAGAMVAAHPGEAWEGIKNGVIGSAIQGKDWRKVVRDHPLFAALELLGGAGAVGRGVGAVGRTASGGRVFGTQRAPLALADIPGTSLYQRRRYSKDVTRQAVQRLVDRALPEGPMVRVNGRLVPSKLSPSRQHRDWRMRRMADFVASRANSRERVNREEMARAALRAAPVRSHKGGRAGAALGEYVDRVLPGGPRYGETGFHPVASRLPKGAYRPEREMVSMVLEGIIRSPARFVSDLKKERSRLEAEYQRHQQAVRDGDTANVLDKTDVLANRQRAQAIDRVLDSPRAMQNAKGVFESARRLAGLFRELESEAIERGALNPERAARSKLFPTAQAHQGAIYDEALRRGQTDQRGGTPLAGAAPAANHGYHGTGTHPDVILKEGLHPGDVGNEGGAVYLAERSAGAETYMTDGGFIYKVTHDQPIQGEVAIRGGVPASHIQLEGRTRVSLSNHQADEIAPYLRVTEAGKKLLGKIEGRRAMEMTIDASEAALLYNAFRKLAAKTDATPHIRMARDLGEWLKAWRKYGSRPRKMQDNALSNRQIVDEFVRQGGDPDLLTYLPHSMKLRGPAAMHQHFGQQRRSYEGQHTRTGEMFKRGASPFDYDHIVDTLVGKSNVVGNIREYDHLLQTVGIRHQDGRYLTAREAHRWIKNHKDDDGNPLPPDLVAKRAFNSRSSEDQLAKIEQQQNITKGSPSSLIEQHYRDRSVLPDDSGTARNVVLIPRAIDGRLADHLGVAGKATATIQTAQGLFRRSVLPLSTKWMFGNVAEAVLRSTVAGVAPVRDNLLGRKVVKALIAQDKRTGKAFEAELIGGLHIGNRGLSNKRGPSTRNIPVVNELLQTIKLATDAGFAFNRMIEREFQFAALGKHARQEMQEMTGSWFKAMRAQQKAVDDLARGLRDTPAQIQAARYLDEVLGQYSRFSPAVRGIVQTYMPFLPWYLNSVRFVAWTLPAKHPLKTALLTRAEATFQEDYEQQHDDALTRKGDLATAVKTKDGGWVPAARYTPFGFLGPLAAGDASDLAALVLPQITGPLLALRGIDPFGQEMTIPKKYGGTGERIEGGPAMLIALNQLLESFVPGVATARRLREGGETALPTSTVFSPKTKPGSSAGQSAVERVFSPLRPIYLRNPNSRTGGGGTVDPVEAALEAIEVDLPDVDEDAVDAALAAIGG